MSTGALSPDLEPGQWRIEGNKSNNIGRKSLDGRSVEVFRVQMVGVASSSINLTKIVEKLNKTLKNI